MPLRPWSALENLFFCGLSASTGTFLLRDMRPLSAPLRKKTCFLVGPAKSPRFHMHAYGPECGKGERCRSPACT